MLTMRYYSSFVQSLVCLATAMLLLASPSVSQAKFWEVDDSRYLVETMNQLVSDLPGSTFGALSGDGKTMIKEGYPGVQVLRLSDEGQAEPFWGDAGKLPFFETNTNVRRTIEVSSNGAFIAAGWYTDSYGQAPRGTQLFKRDADEWSQYGDDIVLPSSCSCDEADSCSDDIPPSRPYLSASADLLLVASGDAECSLLGTFRPENGELVQVGEILTDFVVVDQSDDGKTIARLRGLSMDEHGRPASFSIQLFELVESEWEEKGQALEFDGTFVLGVRPAVNIFINEDGSEFLLNVGSYQAGQDKSYRYQFQEGLWDQVSSIGLPPGWSLQWIHDATPSLDTVILSRVEFVEEGTLTRPVGALEFYKWGGASYQKIAHNSYTRRPYVASNGVVIAFMGSAEIGDIRDTAFAQLSDNGETIVHVDMEDYRFSNSGEPIDDFSLKMATIRKDETRDTDGDGIGDVVDDDDDGDGYLDIDDEFPLDADEFQDFDGDGIGDNADRDDDADGRDDDFDFFPLDSSRQDYCCQKALIVAGGGPYFGNALWPATKNMANFAYETLRFQGLDDDDIIYLSEEELEIVDGLPTNESVRQAVISLAGSPEERVEDVLIYMVDHGGDGVFKLDEQTLLYAEDLKLWLDELHQSYDGKSTVIYDACESGSFVPLLAANDGSQRMVITSSAAKQPAVFALNGYTSFSYFFWSSFYVGFNISDSQILAKQAMSLIWGQDPKFDANGDGLANTKSDKVSIEDFFFGQRAAKASDNPIVGEIQLDTELNGESEVPIRVVEVVGGTSVNKVLVFIDDPDSYIPLPDEPLIEANGTELSQNEDGSWSGVLNGFTIAGNYDVSVVAQNSGGLFSIPDESDSVTVTQLKGRQPVIELDTDFDGLGDLTDADDDNDGVEDTSDDFPLDASESKDSDRDGVGNNADLDDDNDGFTDEEELADGTDPLSRFSCRSGCFSFDVDESLKAQPLTDGLLVIRHLFGFSGDALTSGAVASDANRDASEVIASYLTDADSQLDIDGDGESKPLTDGLLLIRYLFGFSGDSLISGAIGSDATRDTAETVEAYIKERVPSD